ncbi:trans-sialidase, putative, partial [Trypanosoma cruzi marinkellei]
MSRRVFTSAVLLPLLIVMMCCGICGATPAIEEVGKNDLINIQKLQSVNLFVPQKTPVLPKEGGGEGTRRNSFVSPSLVSAGGVMAVIAEGFMPHVSSGGTKLQALQSDIVAVHLNSSWGLASLVAEVDNGTLRAHTVFRTAKERDFVGIASSPKTVSQGNKVFLIVGSHKLKHDTSDNSWTPGDLDVQLVVGEATQSPDGKPSGMIKWGDPKPLLKKETLQTEDRVNYIFPGAGSGVLMENGMLVFPVGGVDKAGKSVSMIVYSRDNGSSWVLSEGVS